MNTIACRACGAPIVFLKRPRKDGTIAVHPVDASTVTPGDEAYDGVRHTSHFDTCPDAWRFRKYPSLASSASPVAKKPMPPAPAPEPVQLGLFGSGGGS